jgi:hypothetical protein
MDASKEDQMAKCKQEEELHRGNEAWLRQEPYLRLYHVIMEDDVKDAYSKAFNVMTRAELDTRHSDTIHTGRSPRMGLKLGLSFKADVANTLKEIQ